MWNELLKGSLSRSRKLLQVESAILIVQAAFFQKDFHVSMGSGVNLRGYEAQH